MKKIFIITLCVLLFFPIFTYSAQAADTKSVSVSVPITVGLTGASNSAKTFYLDLPSGVTSTSVKTGSFKYNGNNSVIGAITIENGKIKMTLKGNEKAETFSVEGKKAQYIENFISVPGNSIWRYSDGRRWQINDYKVESGTNTSYNVNAGDSAMPSAYPPTRTVTTKSEPVNPSQATWFRNGGTDTVPYSSVVQSSIKLNPLTLLGGDVGSTSIKDGNFIVSYTIPSTMFSPEVVSDSFEKGPLVTGRLYYVTLPYYFSGTAKLTSYSYAGNVTFDYNLPTEPTLNGTVTLLAPNPNPTKMENKDVPVQLSIKGELLGYTNTSNIEEWVFYAKEKGSSTVLTKKEYSKVVSPPSKTFDFKILQSKVTGIEFTQEYDLTVIVRFIKPIVTKTGTITSLSQPLYSSASVYKNAPTVTFPPGPSQPSIPQGKPPIARISAPRYVKAGDDILISGGASFDPDGYITDYSWDTSGAQGDIGNNSKGYVWYTKEQIGKDFPIALTVVDNDRLFGSTSAEVTVIEPIPEAKLFVSGTLKQNRKVILDNRSSSPTRFPLVPDKTRLTVTAISGGTNADIKYSGTLGDVGSKDMLFKKPGKYKASIYVENILGYSASQEITFDIVPDIAPVNYFTLPGVVYRNPLNANKATVSLDDMSFSPDKDVIARRIWEYRYDSNNNGSFSDESWIIYDTGNDDRLNLELLEVGKYEIKLTTFEEFGQPTIDEFVTEADRKSTNSDGQALNERTVEVKNRAPEVDWVW